MQTMLDHLSQNAIAYAVTLACIVPILYVSRRHTFPLIMQALEWTTYAIVVHFMVGGIVRFFAWFRDASSFKNAGVGTQEEAEGGFSTPLFDHFWDRSYYEPQWLFYVELSILLVVLFLAWKYRPVTWNKNSYKGKPGAPGSKGAATKLNQTRPQYNRERGAGGSQRK